MSARIQQNRPEAIGDILLRLFAGLSMAFAHGLGKVPPSEQFIEGVTGLGFPMPGLFAWCAGLSELLGGLLLALGLFTRPAALAVAFTMAVAGFGRHAADPFQRKELAFVYLAIGVFYLLSGAGRYSLDAMLSKRHSKQGKG